MNGDDSGGKLRGSLRSVTHAALMCGGAMNWGGKKITHETTHYAGLSDFTLWGG
jgi:hypothetical protein